MPFDPVESFASARHEFGEHGGVNMSIEASTTFTVMHARTMPEIFGGHVGPDAGGCFLYSRHFNPTVYALGHGLAALEGTESAYPTASGMSAIACALMQLCSPGDHIVSSNTVYGGTFALMHDYFPARTNINTTFVDITDLDAVASAITDHTRSSTPSPSPTPRSTSRHPRARRPRAPARRRLVVDNTFSPMMLSPAQLGADVVVYSLTKFIGGSSDIVAGAICGPARLHRLPHGPPPRVPHAPRPHHGPPDRLPPLPPPAPPGIRMVEHGRPALAFAEPPRAPRRPVVYPGLPSHPHHHLLARLANPDYGFGGLFTVDLATTERAGGSWNFCRTSTGSGTWPSPSGTSTPS
ncbi:MAG: PLP-dependent transferase [Phycisphaerales bacterium]